MKKIISAISGKKSLNIMTALVSICTVLDILASVRTGSRVDFFAIGTLYTVLAAWAAALNK